MRNGAVFLPCFEHGPRTPSSCVPTPYRGTHTEHGTGDAEELGSVFPNFGTHLGGHTIGAIIWRLVGELGSETRTTSRRER